MSIVEDCVAGHKFVPDKPHDLCSVEIGEAHVTFCGLLFSPQQSCATVVPGSELNPAGQAWHAADPVAFLNVPAAHATQEPPSGPVNPTAHCAFARANRRRKRSTCMCGGIFWLIVYDLYMDQKLFLIVATLSLILARPLHGSE